MKRITAATAVVVSVLLLAGCGGGYAKTREQIKEQAAFVKECEAAGGRASYNGIPEQICIFESEDEK